MEGDNVFAEEMILRYKQPDPWGCSLFAAANVLTLSPEFLSDKRLSQQKDGGWTHELDRYLYADHGIVTSVLYEDCVGVSDKLPDAVCGLTVSGNAKPLLIGGIPKEDGLRHMVGAILFPNKTLRVLDSTMYKEYDTSLHMMNDDWHSIDTVRGFKYYDTGEWLFLESSTK